jgi:hypothetical protein
MMPERWRRLHDVVFSPPSTGSAHPETSLILAVRKLDPDWVVPEIELDGPLSGRVLDCLERLNTLGGSTPGGSEDFSVISLSLKSSLGGPGMVAFVEIEPKEEDLSDSDRPPDDFACMSASLTQDWMKEFYRELELDDRKNPDVLMLRFPTDKSWTAVALGPTEADTQTPIGDLEAELKSMLGYTESHEAWLASRVDESNNNESVS